MTMSVVMNLAVVLITAGCCIWYFVKKRTEKSPLKGVEYFRYFTQLSNIFAALSCLAFLAAQGTGKVPLWVVLWRFMACTAVFVTMVTVLAYLGPLYGYPAMFYEDQLYMHLVGPLLNLVSFCFFERGQALSMRWVWLGSLPVFIYGVYYLNRTVFVGEEKGGWPDFYGFNREGRWKVSFVSMVLLSLVLSAVVLLVRGRALG